MFLVLPPSVVAQLSVAVSQCTSLLTAYCELNLAANELTPMIPSLSVYMVTPFCMLLSFELDADVNCEPWFHLDTAKMCSHSEQCRWGSIFW